MMSPRRAKQRYQNYAKQMAGAFGLDELLNAAPEDAERIAQIETAVIDFHATQRAVQGAQKAIAYEYLLRRLEKAGHRVSEVKCSLEKSTSELWKEIQESIWQDDAAAIATATIEPQHDEKWAFKTLSSNDSSRAKRLKAQKVLWQAEFPGVTFDDPEECYEALCLDYGAMRRGVLLQVQAENLGATRQADMDRAQAVLTADVKALHRLPKKLARATLIAKLQVLELLDGKEYCNHAKLAQTIKAAALANAGAIREFLGLTIREHQTPSEIVNKLLRKLGLEIDRGDREGAVKRLRREGGRGEQRWIYSVDLAYSPTRQKLLEAAQLKASEAGSHDFFNTKTLTREIMTTAPEPPVNRWGRAVNWEGESFRLRRVEGAIAYLAPMDCPDVPESALLEAPHGELELVKAA